MTRDELLDILASIQTNKRETQTLEIKAAATGCPKRLYDTLSSFSNQDDGAQAAYAMQSRIEPLIARGLVVRTIPDKPRSKLQKFVAR